jgi:pectinesterase
VEVSAAFEENDHPPGKRSRRQLLRAGVGVAAAGSLAVAAVLWVPPAANAAVPVNGTAYQQWRLAPVPVATPTVAADGSGTYRTVQAAIDAVPAGNTSRVTITIKPGTYREVVTVPSNKPMITLQGLGSSPSQVVVVYHNSAYTHGTSGSATAFVSGRDFVATNLTISNDFDESSTPSGHQAVALNLSADRAVLRNVRLLGDQDTFLAGDSARAYLVGSYVEGTVDFIFGGGTLVLDNCDIYEKRPTGGPITAASTPATKTYGFLFHRSRIRGAAAAGTTHLGRPWRPDAQVLYRESTLDAVVRTAQPWTDMSGNLWQNARFLEYRNTGAGAGTGANRPQLSDAQAANYTPQKYLAGSDGWNPVG